MLKKDFDCDLTRFESELPMDDSGVNVPIVMDRMRQAVRDIPGFEVIEEAAIAPFSFAKYLMWKDLVDRVGQLENNRVVRHLIHEPDKAFSSGGTSPMPQPHELDTRYSPADIVHPLPADSSQLAAVMAAAEGHDLVIVGPPGTGKSQTIANLIAQCLAGGKTVLFVAEKTAALDVVHRRLRAHGLEDCCVELHSNKAERRRFLDQLERSWKNRRDGDASEWIPVSDKLRLRRDQLNAYSVALHSQELNGWTPYRAMGESVRGQGLDTPRLTWPASVRHSREQYEDLLATITQLATTFAAVPANATMPRVQATEWSMAWESSLVDACTELAATSATLASSLAEFAAVLEASTLKDISAVQLGPLYRLAQQLTRPSIPAAGLLRHDEIDDLQSLLANRAELLEGSETAVKALEAALAGFGNALGATMPVVVPEEMKRAFYRLANALVRSSPPPAELVFHKHFEALASGLAERPSLLDERDRAFHLLEERHFNPSLVDRIKINDLDNEWSKATKSFWPLSRFRKEAVRRKLKAFMTDDGTAEPDIDLPILGEYRDSVQRLADNLAALELPSHMQLSVAKDAGALNDAMDSARTVREAMQGAGLSVEAVNAAAHGILEPLIIAARRLRPLAKEIDTFRGKLRDNLAAVMLPAELLSVVETDADALAPQLEATRSIHESLAALGLSPEDRSRAVEGVIRSPGGKRRTAAGACGHGAKAFQLAWAAYSKVAYSPPAPKESTSVVADAAIQANLVLSRRTLLKQWTVWMAVQKQAAEIGLSSFVETLQAGSSKPNELVAQFTLAYARWWLPSVVDQRTPLRTFQKFLHEDAISDFRRLDDIARRAAAPRARHAVLHGLPSIDQVPRQSELGLLRHQMGLKRPSKSIREVISGMPGTFGQLAPCLLMSPLSIAQYLPADQAQFDVVVFDEASQIATWDAIGAIARGKQTIIVGDPKQLPPTNFFGKVDNDEDNSELDDHEKDLESILDEAQASGLPTLQLNWHYRSRHESLIAFSNWNYYGNHLVTFPAAESHDRGVSLQHVKGAIYDRGKSRTNRQEAETIVTHAVDRMKRCLRKPESQRLTYGVVTFNSQQQELLQDLLDEAQRQHPELEWFYSDDRIEPTVVKNLENVQGDERDVMMFSLTFGFDAAGKFPVDFGAINREGGERRLNVAVTRARQELVVYASFLPEQVRSERSAARGVHDLKAFLEYADKGPEALIARSTGSLGGPESPLEEAVAAALESRGWRLDPQVGISGFRIDLGVVHPDKPGAYLAGIECDGATYHRSAVARDRDKTRQQVLENLGWNILRVWSTDWWYDPDAAVGQIVSQLEDLLHRDRERSSADDDGSQDSQTANISDHANSVVNAERCLDSLRGDEDTRLDMPPTETTSRPQLVAKQATSSDRVLYEQTDLGDRTANQSRFFDDDYDSALRDMAMAVIQQQGPIRDDALAREIARAHGFARTGNRIKQRVMDLLGTVTFSDETAGRFLWFGSKPQDSVQFRYASRPGSARSLEEIAMPELIGLVRENPQLLSADDPAIALAREIGLARLAKPARERLEQAIDICK